MNSPANNDLLYSEIKVDDGHLNPIKDISTTRRVENEFNIEFISAHADYLFNYAVARVRNGTVAEDLVQDTFLAALAGKSPFVGKSSGRTWLIGILRHKIFDHYRKTTREQNLRVLPNDLNQRVDNDDTNLMWLDRFPSENTHPSRRLELDEIREDLKDALRALSPRIARVFQMYAVEEQSHLEVCEQLGISNANMWVMLHRARKLMRTFLTNHWEDCE